MAKKSPRHQDLQLQENLDSVP